MHKIRFNQNLGYFSWLKTILLIFIAFFSTFTSIAQAPSTLVIGNTSGSGNWFYGPIYRNTTNAGTLNYSRHAYIYTPAELSAIPSGAKITKLEWLKKDGGTIAAPNTFNVYLSNTPSVSFPGSATWGSLITGATQTYGNAAFPLTIGNNTYLEATFNIPGNDSFIYSGGSLQILTDWAKGGVQTGAGINFFVLGAAGKAIGIASSTNLSNSSNLIASTYGNSRPTLRITYVPVPPCSGTPTTGPALSSVTSSCANVPFTLSITNTLSGSGISFVWQRSADSTFTTGVTNVGTSSTLVTTSTGSFYYRCTATCLGSGLSSTSTNVYVPLSPHYQCYCGNSAISAIDEEIFNFRFGSLCNSSDCNSTAPGAGSTLNSYSNYQSITPPNVELTSAVPFSIETGTCPGYLFNRSAIFIDYNHNASFSDPGELVYSTSGPISGPHTEVGEIVIPATAMLGLTGIRIITSETGNPITLSCGYYSFGETEDYLINIVPASSCSGFPSPGNTIAAYSVGCAPVNSVTICSGQSVSLTIQNNNPGSGFSYQWYQNNNPIPGAVSAIYMTAPVTSVQSYYCKVTCANSGLESNSSPMTITLKPFLECYCPSMASVSDDADIFSMTMNGITIATNCNTVAPGPGSVLNQYSNFYTLGSIDTFLIDATIPFDFETDDCDQAPYYSFGTAIWIDYNHNGSFEDAGEKAFVEAVPDYSPRHIIGNFKIPCQALEGQTAMRITIAGSHYGSNLTSCLQYSDGETEDYLVYLKRADTCSFVNNLPGNTETTVKVFCDSAESVLSLNNKCMFGNFTYQWFSRNLSTAPWVLIPGATSSTYTTIPKLTADLTLFYCLVTCPTSMQSESSAQTSIYKLARPISVGPTSPSYCLGDSTPVTLISSLTTGGVNYPTIYTWTPAVNSSNISGSAVTVTPTNTTTYTVTSVTTVSGGATCVSSGTKTVVATTLNVDLVASSSTYCPASSSQVILSSSGGINYVYSPSTGLSSTTGNSVFATPSSTSTYVVTGKTLSGCTGFDTTTITVNNLNWTLDADGDGYSVGSAIINCASPGAGYTSNSTISGDCNDNDNTIHSTFPFYLDNDGDFFGAGPVQNLCTINGTNPPAGYALVGGDCDDNNNTIHDSFPFYLDIDGDGFGAGSLQNVCAVDANTPPLGFALVDGDCNDNNSLIHAEFSFYIDNDGDGFGIGALQAVCAVDANTPPTGFTLTPGDCNDNLNSVYPGAAEICGNGIDDNCNSQIDEGCSLVLNLKLFIESYYLGSGLMNSVLANQSVGTSSTICDSATVELHQAVAPYAFVIGQKIVINTDGTGMANFAGTIPGSYYIVVKHRNALETWSAAPVAISTTTYDFSSAATQAFGSNMKQVEPGVWGFFSGELNSDENIDLLDLGILELDLSNFEFGYFPTDLNGDGSVDLLDSPALEQNSNDFVFSAHP